MKLSRYNFPFFHDGKNYLYNSFTNAMITLRPEIVQLVDNWDESILSSIPKEAFDPLLQGGYLIEKEKDELTRLKVRNRMSRFSNRELGLTIAPTLDCNFKCIYCFEEPSRAIMTTETADAVYDYVLEALHDKKGLGVCWYGGEPLLAFDIMEKLTRRFKSLCRTMAIPYEADIISNGYLMTPEVAKKLTQEMSVRFWQVTLDGPPAVHNARRPLQGGGESFDTVLKNLEASCHLFERIAVRINIDRTNPEQVNELLGLLEQKELQDKVSVYFGQVQAIGAACPGISHQCLSTPEFSKVEMSLNRLLVDRGWPVSMRPSLKGGVCLADQVNSYLIDPSGNLAKCWNCAGVESQKVGTIFETKPNDNFFRWLSFDPFEDPECRNCKMLPVCMGGCPYDKVIDQKKDCFTQKYNLIDRLKLRIDGWKKAESGQGGKHE
ncbi:MAG: hypothetical protein BA870_09305 [Desulfuromonadales bacterium C00003094]|nr:MAG: hypothetical protein BA870_09305 [Desulfuromonadales bacterium C00003094]OEU77321.1 MAG: hypothetical protein BA869_09795 [Desulfuromonadales bacterium C00003107]